MRNGWALVLVIAACGPNQNFYPNGGGANASAQDGGAQPGEDGGGVTPNDDAATPPKNDGGVTPSDTGAPGNDAAPIDDDAGPEFNVPPQCTSNTYWTSGDTGSANMHPGLACRKCHVLGGSASKKTFDIGGTLYPTAHEPDDCNGIGNATIVITDANGATHSLSVNAVGNFSNDDLFGIAPIPKPYKAKVVVGGKERPMITPQTDGDCNNCHTQNGTQSAPGRLIVPL
jgi:hypothetical protein